MIQINPAALPSQTFYAVLGGHNCSLKLYQRGDHLYLDLWTADGDVCRGAICRNGADVLQSPSPLFKGSLHFYDFRGVSDPAFEGLGNRYALLFIPEGETVPEYFRF
jgi:hypothetical protein